MPDWNQFAAFHFLRPWWLLSLLPFAFVMSYLWRQQDPVARWRKIIAPNLLRHLLVRGGQALWLNPVRLSLVVTLIGIVALAGPSWERRTSPFARDEAAMVIALDVSSSMTQDDIQPSRLERAKQKIHDLLELRGGARTGLIVYSGSAHAVIPLTNDPDIVTNFLDAIVPEMMPRSGKLAETVLPVADTVLRDSLVPGTLLLITDGVSPDAADLFHKYFTASDHLLIVLGVGTEGKVGQRQEGVDEPDRILVPLDSRGLQSLANRSGGYFQDLSLDRTDVARVNRRVNNHLVLAGDSSRPWIDAGYYLLFPVALGLLFWYRKGWTLYWSILLIAVPGSFWSTGATAAEFRFADLWMTPDQQGRYYFEQGDYRTAAERFADPMWKGIAFYMDEDFLTATEYFSRIDAPEGLFNLGNAWAHSRNYVYAVRSYDLVLEKNPHHEGALKNRARIQAIIDEINQMSEAQVAEEGESSRELGDQPLTAEGAERDDAVPAVIEQYSAEELLNDPRLNEIWMRQVQADPALFLAVKFHMQLERAASRPDEQARDEP